MHAEQENQQSKKRAPKLRKLFLGFLGGLALLLLLVPAALFLWLGSDSGRAFLERQIAEQTAASSTARVELVGLKGSVPWNFTFDQLHIADAEGIWLTADGARFVLHPLQLLSLHIHVSEIYFDNVTLFRMPPAQEEEAQQVSEAPEGAELFPELPTFTLEYLGISHLHIKEDVMGKELDLAAWAEANNIDKQTLLSLHVARAGALDVDEFQEGIAVELLRREESLFVDAELKEPGGGFLSVLAGLPPRARFTMALGGKGPAEDWQGSLRARTERLSAEERIDLDLDLALSLPQVGFPDGATFAANGHVKSAELLPEGPAQELIGESLDIALRTAVEGDARLLLQSLQILGKGLQLDASGVLATDKNTFELSTALKLLRPSDLLPADVRLSGLTPLILKASGSLDAPKLRLDLKADACEAGGVDLQKLMLQASADLGDAVAGELELSIEEAALADSGIAPGPAYIIIDAEAQGSSIDVVLREAAAFGLAGNARVQVREAQVSEEQGGVGNGSRVLVDAGISIEENFALLPPELRNLLGPSLLFVAAAQIHEEHIVLEKAGLNATGADLNVRGRFAPDNGTFSARGELDIPELGILELGILELGILEVQAGDKGLSGPLGLRFRADGSAERFTAGFNASSPQIVLGPELLRQFALDVRAEGLPDAVQGRLDCSLGFRDERLTAGSSFAMDNATILVEDFDFRAGKARASSEILRFNTETQLAEGRILADIPDLGLMEGLGGPSAAGSLNLDLRASNPDGTQQLQVNAAGKDLEYEASSLEDFKLEGRLRLEDDLPVGRAVMKVRNARSADVLLQDAELKFQGKPEKANLGITMKGRALEPFNLNSDMGYSIVDDVVRISLESLDGVFSDIPLRLRNRAEILLQGQGFRSEALELDLGEGSLRLAEGFLSEEDLLIEADIEDLALESLQTFVQQAVTGRLDAKLSARGKAAEPSLNLSALVEGFSLQEGPAAKAPKLRLEMKAAAEAGELTAEGEVLGLGPEALQGRVRMPLALSLAPPSFSFSEEDRLDAELMGKVDLSPLPEIFDLGDTLLEGFVDLNMEIAGSIGEPDLLGSLDYGNGRFENLEAGVFFQNITASAAFEGERINLKSLRADDGIGGALDAKGSYTFGGDSASAYEAELSLNGTRLVSLPNVKAAASGDLSISGDKDAAELTAMLTTKGVNIEIPSSPPSVTTLEYEHVNATRRKKKDEPQGEGGGYPLTIDARVDMPNRVFVRGRGMDIELAGFLTAKGTTPMPAIAGELSAVRGRISFAGRTFIVSEGEVFLDGRIPPSPLLNISARGKAGDIIAIVSVRGPADDFSLSLSSEPALPEDEVISHILFGRSVSELNPVQAIILADSYRTLSGGGGPGIMAKARNFLGVDQLNVGTDEESGGVDVGVGKYLREDVYLEFEQNVETGARGARVEVEITPEISVESSTNTDGGGIGVNWKKNF
jgi:translocation and assembly module TamB